jgi:hypothetical protein
VAGLYAANVLQPTVTLATAGLLLASSTVRADGHARKWAAIKKWTGTVNVRLTFKGAPE